MGMRVETTVAFRTFALKLFQVRFVSVFVSVSISLTHLSSLSMRLASLEK